MIMKRVLPKHKSNLLSDTWVIKSTYPKLGKTYVNFTKVVYRWLIFSKGAFKSYTLKRELEYYYENRNRKKIKAKVIEIDYHLNHYNIHIFLYLSKSNIVFIQSPYNLQYEHNFKFISYINEGYTINYINQ